MDRLCGGAHEISSIKAPIFLHGWVGFGGVGVRLVQGIRLVRYLIYTLLRNCPVLS